VTIPEIVATDQLTFFEEETMVPVGGTVRWVSDSDFEHTVTPHQHDEWVRQESDRRGQVIFEHEFETVGTFEFYCEKHTGMVGRVLVHPH